MKRFKSPDHAHRFLEVHGILAGPLSAQATSSEREPVYRQIRRIMEVLKDRGGQGVLRGFARLTVEPEAERTGTRTGGVILSQSEWWALDPTPGQL